MLVRRHISCRINPISGRSVQYGIVEIEPSCSWRKIWCSPALVASWGLWFIWVASLCCLLELSPAPVALLLVRVSLRGVESSSCNKKNSHNKIRTKRETVRGNNLAITTKFVENEKLQSVIMHVKHLDGINEFEFEKFPRFLNKQCIRITQLCIISIITNTAHQYCITIHFCNKFLQ